MTQTTNEPLSGVDLAIEVAEEVMGWPLTPRRQDIWTTKWPQVNNDHGDGCLYVFRDRYTPGELWEPWRDPRAYMEIVGKMREMGYEVAIHFGAETVSVFYGEPTGSYLGDELWDGDETAQTPGEAVMLAALAAVRAQG